MITWLFPGTVFFGGTGGTGGTAGRTAHFWWDRTVGPVGPPWKIADPRGQPWAHWSHLSVPPVRANSCGVPPVPPVPPEETVRRNEDGIWDHDGSLSRLSAGSSSVLNLAIARLHPPGSTFRTSA